MGVKWRDFQMPKRLDGDESSYNSHYGKFIAEPFERGYGVTLGNSLRRILLSSISRSADTFLLPYQLLSQPRMIPSLLPIGFAF